MNIKYDNSMYCTNPPRTVIDLRTPNEVLECEIADRIDEENYYNQQLKDFDMLEQLEFMELIKNEPNCDPQPVSE